MEENIILFGVVVEEDESISIMYNDNMPTKCKEIVEEGCREILDKIDDVMERVIKEKGENE